MHDLLRIFCCVFALFSRIILFIMSSSDEIDNPAAVDSSGSEFEEEDVTQERRRVNPLSHPTHTLHLG